MKTNFWVFSCHPPTSSSKEPQNSLSALIIWRHFHSLNSFLRLLLLFAGTWGNSFYCHRKFLILSCFNSPAATNKATKLRFLSSCKDEISMLRVSMQWGELKSSANCSLSLYSGVCVHGKCGKTPFELCFSENRWLNRDTVKASIIRGFLLIREV